MRILFAALFSIFTLGLSAQPYAFSKATEPYQELTNPDYAVTDDSQYWNGGQLLIKPDMSVKAFGVNFNLSEGIYMVIQQGYFYMYSADGQHSLTFDNFAADLQPRKGSTVSEFSFKLDGSAGSKIFKMQFKNLGLLIGDESEFVNYQVWLHERGLIEVRFGSNHVQAASYDGKPGPAIGLLHMDDQFSNILDEFYIGGDPSSPTTYNTGVYMNGTPPDATVYRFEPEHMASINEIPGAITFSAYPNPAKDALKLNFLASANGELSLTDLTGRILIRKTVNAFRKENSLDISGISAGVYVLTFRSGGEYKSIRILKE